jgi:hypothetical protein
MSKSFNPHTGAYWHGWEDAISGAAACPPEEYSDQGKQDYREGYDAALTDLKRLPRQPHETPQEHA